MGDSDLTTTPFTFHCTAHSVAGEWLGGRDGMVRWRVGSRLTLCLQARACIQCKLTCTVLPTISMEKTSDALYVAPFRKLDTGVRPVFHELPPLLPKPP